MRVCKESDSCHVVIPPSGRAVARMLSVNITTVATTRIMRLMRDMRIRIRKIKNNKNKKRRHL
jgi:hypothetical protein